MDKPQLLATLSDEKAFSNIRINSQTSIELMGAVRNRLHTLSETAYARADNKNGNKFAGYTEMVTRLMEMMDRDFNKTIYNGLVSDEKSAVRVRRVRPVCLFCIRNRINAFSDNLGLDKSP